ncbi:MAG: glycosyltransferase family 2 protein [Candidatus Hodarchaeota archaeon]
MLEIIFWFCILFITYTYFGYPLLLKIILLFKKNEVQKANLKPSVTLIITAHNEEKRIINKLKNTLSLNYPRDKLQIIVASDSSMDNTNKIVKSFESKGITLIRSHERRGKEYAQKLAVKKAKGNIFVFSDVATILKKDALENIVSNFNDPTVGCVSSEDRIFSDDGTITGENFYVKYEMLLRRLESKVNSLVGLSGSFFAARREVCQNWAEDLQSDFNTLLNSIKIGLRGISDPGSIGYYKNVRSEKQEFNRKIRTVLRGISVFMNNIGMLNPLKYGFFSIQILSHKLFRWLIPFALISAFFTNLLLVRQTFYASVFISQLMFYTLAIIAFNYKVLIANKIFKIPFFFTITNLSIFIAWYRYLIGQRLVSWEPSNR